MIWAVGKPSVDLMLTRSGAPATNVAALALVMIGAASTVRTKVCMALGAKPFAAVMVKV